MKWEFNQKSSFSDLRKKVEAEFLDRLRVAKEWKDGELSAIDRVEQIFNRDAEAK